jgi:threonylcarbamoyladenosine tRNA methylthiotransferase MtaB
VTRIRIITLGCKVNQCDGDEMARALVSAGYEIVSRGDADAYIVNTCTVTATADAKARKLIRKLAREHPGARLIVTGCWAQCHEKEAALPGVSAVVLNVEKVSIVEALGKLVPPPDGRGNALPNGHDGRRACSPYPPYITASSRTRAFLKVQDGCDHHCAYCAVPSARGLPTSKPLDDALAELRRIADEGAQEVVLCGIRLGAYGRGHGGAFGLAGLLRSLRQVPIPRVRLSSIEPMDVGDDLLKEMADHPTLCHHLHLPLQAGDDAVLSDMGRGHTSADFSRLVARMRGVWPDVSLTTDVMVGFPGETDEQFERTVQFVREVGFSRLHVFPYSPRPGTPAMQRSDQLPAPVKRERAQRLIAIGAELAQQAALAWVGREVGVLFEERKAGRLTGLTRQYLRVWCDGPEERVGRIVSVIPHRAERGELEAVVGTPSGRTAGWPAADHEASP